MGEEVDLNKLRDEALARRSHTETQPPVQRQEAMPTDEQLAEVAASTHPGSEPVDPSLDALREIAKQRRAQRDTETTEVSDTPPAA